MQSPSADFNAGPGTTSEAPLTDDELLAIVRAERSRSIGFDLDPELTDARERALNYFKGEMPDVVSLPNRSKATTSDIADAVETVLPDLADIFTGGDDVVTFVPKNADDEPWADQETEYVRHVVFDDNDGFMTHLTWFKDALLTKTGIVKSWWEKAPEVDPETFEGKTAVEVQMARLDGEVVDLQPSDGVSLEDPEPTYDFKLIREGPDGRVRIKAIAPEDFTVARDTVRLKDASYSAFRSRPRAQELIADGHPRSIIDLLPPSGAAKDEQVRLARDTAGENEFAIGNDGPDRDRRSVEVVEHYVRLLDGDNLQIWRVVTGGDETILITKEQVDGVPFAAITPYVVTHRFYGESVADKLIEIQRIKTALLRMALDNGYFALNQRHEVVMPGVNQFTIGDLLDNRPGVPIRVDVAGTVNPMQGAQAPYDYFGALEYMSTQAESRTGIVRNAQGLNPDTLHDTASGALALMGAAQRRVRMIARIFAETGVKDLYLDVHALLRKHASKQAITKLRGQWVPVDPSSWNERNQVTVEVGVGSGGKDQRLAMLTKVIQLQESVVKALGPSQTLVTPENAYAAFLDAAKAGGLKSAQSYFTDPKTAPPQQPQPNPDAIKAQAEAATNQQKAQLETAKLSADQQQSQAKLQFDGARLQADQQDAAADRQLRAQAEQLKHDLAVASLQAENQRERERLAAEMQLKQAELKQRQDEFLAKQALDHAKMRQDGELKVLAIQAQYQTTIDAAQVKAASDALRSRTDLEIQAQESADAHLLAASDHAHEAAMAEQVRDNAPPAAPNDKDV